MCAADRWGSSTAILGPQRRATRRPTARGYLGGALLQWPHDSAAPRPGLALPRWHATADASQAARFSRAHAAAREPGARRGESHRARRRYGAGRSPALVNTGSYAIGALA